MAMENSDDEDGVREKRENVWVPFLEKLLTNDGY